METKKCTKCGDVYPATLEYFNKSNSRACGLVDNCKKCSNYWKKWPGEVENKEVFAIEMKIEDGYKKCTKCGDVYPTTDEYFYKHKYTKDRWLSQCKKCRNGWNSWPEKIKDGFKKCNNCGEVYPATSEYFHRCRNLPCGVVGQCKKCYNKWDDWPTKVEDGMRKCSRCGDIFPLTLEFFPKESYRKGGVGYACKSCLRRQYKKNKINGMLKPKSIISLEEKREYHRRLYEQNKELYNKRKSASMKLPVSYKTYASKISYAEKVKEGDNGKLMVRCVYCNKWFIPTRSQVKLRTGYLKGIRSSECRLYCSDGCKDSCPIYRKKSWPKGFKKATSREVNPLVRQMAFEKDNWTCQKCGATGEGVTLHAHHIKGYTQNKILGNDVDNIITLCKECHKDIHKQDGCTYYDLRCK